MSVDSTTCTSVAETTLYLDHGWQSGKYWHSLTSAAVEIDDV